jgi:MFS family permease
MTFAIDVITLDTSTLRNRGLAYAFTSSPNIIVAYAGPNVAQKFYEKNWRWAFGAFAIILPVVAAPMVGVLLHAKSEAKKKGFIQPKTPSGRTFMQSVSHYLIEFDSKSADTVFNNSQRQPSADRCEQLSVPSF